jgi:hypothetical protein
VARNISLAQGKGLCEREHRETANTEARTASFQLHFVSRFQTAGVGANQSSANGMLVVRARYTISGPLRSVATFAPTCSIRRRQFAPR